MDGSCEKEIWVCVVLEGVLLLIVIGLGFLLYAVYREQKSSEERFVKPTDPFLVTPLFEENVVQKRRTGWKRLFDESLVALGVGLLVLGYVFAAALSAGKTKRRGRR